MTARTAAIHYVVDGFTMDRTDVKGRHSAGVGFIGGLARHLPGDPVYCYAPSRQAAQHCADAITAAAGRTRMVRHIPFGQESLLAEAGCLFISSPGIAGYAWRRRFLGQRGYSLCGLTHTICSDRVLDSFGEFMTAPLQPWDALVCTSSAARAAIEGLLEQWADYLEQRIGARPHSALRLPVIPLGVDCDRFADGPDNRRRRAEFRQRFGIAEDDVALLFFGRLSFHAKAHPVAMLQAAELAAKATGKRLHILMAGRFNNASVAKLYTLAAGTYAPSVRYHVVDGADEALSRAVWFGADVFLSLSDNVQETFGLTPIEAQAAGLPAVVSDWDGYKDTVAEGETGFRIPTAIPPPGPGEDLAGLYLAEAVSFDRYIGAASLCTHVDVRRCGAVLARLAADGELRGRMSDQARRRARALYDWKVVIGQYAALWGELADIRAHAREVAPPRPGAPPAPLRDDPFRTFGDFASRRLTGDASLTADESCLPLAAALGNEMNTYMAPLFLPEAVLQQIVADLRQQPATADELCRRHDDPRMVWRSIMWLLKLGVIREAGP